MEESLKDVIEASSPSDVQAESSPADDTNVSAPAETPAKQVEQKENVPFDQHPRWKEVQENAKMKEQEAQYWREQAQKALDLANGLKPREQAVDPYAGMTPEEKAFYQKVRELAREEAQSQLAEKTKVYDQALQQYERETVKTIYDDFKSKNPDITSEDEVKMAQLVRPLRSSGMTAKEALDAAYRVVFFDRNAAKSVQQVKQQVNTKIQQKAAANIESSSVVPKGIPTKDKPTVRDFVMAKAKEMGY